MNFLPHRYSEDTRNRIAIFLCSLFFLIPISIFFAVAEIGAALAGNKSDSWFLELIVTTTFFLNIAFVINALFRVAGRVFWKIELVKWEIINIIGWFIIWAMIAILSLVILAIK